MPNKSPTDIMAERLLKVNENSAEFVPSSNSLLNPETRLQIIKDRRLKNESKKHNGNVRFMGKGLAKNTRMGNGCRFRGSISAIYTESKDTDI